MKVYYEECPVCRDPSFEGSYVNPLTGHAHARGKSTPESRSFGPMCRCGARNTARIGDSALVRQCQDCGETYAYRLEDGLLIPYALTTALEMESK